jgi:hypothetical protein
MSILSRASCTIESIVPNPIVTPVGFEWLETGSCVVWHVCILPTALVVIFEVMQRYFPSGPSLFNTELQVVSFSHMIT